MKDVEKKRVYRLLVESYTGDLYRYAVWLCKDPVNADDLVQETCLRAWKSLDKLKDHSAAKGWLIRILRNEYARQFSRYRPVFVETELDEVAKKDVANDTSSEAFFLRRAIDELAEEYREPLLLQVLGGFSCEEIGEMCGLTKGATMTRLFRAKQKLRAQLEAER
ncbi:MAG: RNA polymerase subunit sigma [Gammaproteobacteria bacterium]|nr:MAG: RNA polymerase subunit sigma [Gammaproteobacteria bacterium]